MTSRRRVALAATALAATVAGLLVAGIGTAFAAGTNYADGHRTPVSVHVKAPANRDVAGVAGTGWIVDLAIDYPGGATGLHRAGFTAPQLTGPAGHNNIAPFPGTFAPGHDDRLPGLVVLVSTTAGFSGPGTNLANLFNVTGVANRTARETEIWDTWIVGAPLFGVDVDTTLTVAVVDDLNHNGVYDDAPDVVSDANHDGRVDARDLQALGIASTVETVHFHISGAGM